MQETGYHDVSIFDMVTGGIPLYGEHDVPQGIGGRQQFLKMNYYISHMEKKGYPGRKP